MTVPPPVIAANRVLLATLIATNFFGQNTPSIAATEAQYAEMWAQDAVAMYSYAGSSALASELTPFSSCTEHHQALKPIADQANAVSQGQRHAQAGNTAQTVTSQGRITKGLKAAKKGGAAGSDNSGGRQGAPAVTKATTTAATGPSAGCGTPSKAA